MRPWRLAGSGTGADGHGAVALVVEGDGLDRLALPADRVEVDAHAAHLALGVGLAGRGVELVDVGLALLAHAEHVLLLAGEVAVGEALAREALLQALHLLPARQAALPEGLGVDLRDDGSIFGALHAPFDLEAGDARLLQLLQVLDEAVVLEGERIVVHAPAERVLQAAGLRAHAAVAAAAADEAGHVALAGVAEAERPVHEDLRLHGAVLRDEADLLEAQLARQYDALHAELGRGLHAREVVDAHLRARVQRDVRQGAADHRGEAQILQDQPVHADGVGQAGRLQRGVHLPVVDEGVERQVDLAAADMAVAHGLFQLFLVEVFGSAAGVEVAHAEIHGVRAVLHGGDDGLGRARGRKQFDHSFCLLKAFVVLTKEPIAFQGIISHQRLLLQEQIDGIMCTT